MSEDSGTQQTQSRRHIVVTSLNDWLYRRCQIVENERFADVNLERCGNVNPLSANFIKWSNTLKQFVGKSPTNCLSVFDHFVKLTLKELTFPFCKYYCQKYQDLDFPLGLYKARYQYLY